MAHDEYQEMLAAKALSALDASEARALDAHLATCAECRSQLAEWEETASWISLDAKPEEPSADVRERILNQLTAERATSQSKAQVIEMPPRESRSTWFQKWGAIAAAITIVFLAASLLALWRQNKRAKEELVKLSRQVDDTRQQLDHEREILSVMTTPGARMMELAGTNVAPGAHATVAYDQSGRAVLMAKDLPPPPPGKAYQLWFITGGQPLPGKAFKTNASGEGMLNDQIPTHAINASAFAVTLEPEGGMPKPSGEIYLKS